MAEEDFDVIVAGSGAAGLAGAVAALACGLRVLVLEKADLLGGGSATANGGVWVGDNHLQREAGMADSPDEVLAYMRFLAAGHAIDANLQTFATAAPRAVEFFARRGVPFAIIPGLPDHYVDNAPGAKTQGRMLEVEPASGFALGAWRERSRATSPLTPSHVTFREMMAWGGARAIAQWDHALIDTRAQQDVRTRGAGLVAHLLRVAIDGGAELRLSTPVQRLELIQGRVSGVVVADASGGEQLIRAHRGVLIACGGYESNPSLVTRYETFPDLMSLFPASIEGDGLVLAGEIGAATHVVPTNLALFLGFRGPGREPGVNESFYPAGVEMLPFPHSLVVNGDGRRFTDESYFQTFLNALRQFDVWQHRYPNLPCFFVFDQQYVDKYAFGNRYPREEVPAWMPRADSLDQLAAQLGIDAAGLAETVQRFNRFAEEGVDRDFQRGGARWSKTYSGDRGQRLNANLGPLGQPPFYGARMAVGGLSSAGLLTDVHARVMHVRARPIAGLYASGNAVANIEFGAGYQAGQSLARGLTASWLAVGHMAGRDKR